MAEQPTFHVHQRVTVHSSVATIFFGVGVIAALEEGQALVQWNNRVWKTEHWVSQKDCAPADVSPRWNGLFWE